MAYRGRTIGLGLAVAAALAAASPQPAAAQGFFERLFGGGGGGGFRQGRPVDRNGYPIRLKRSKAAEGAPRVRISAPSYYTYKADSLAAVDFAKLAAALAPAGAEPSLTGAAFRDALRDGLPGVTVDAEPAIAKALVDHYAAHPDFIWVSGLSANGRASEALRVLGASAADGLDPADYQVAVPQAAFDLGDTAGRLRELARFEMALSARVLRYARDAHGGRVDPNRLSGYYDFPAKPVDLPAVLAGLAATQDVAATLAALHPESPEYRALRAELEALTASAENDIVVDPKLLLKPGEISPELPKVLALIARSLADEPAPGGDAELLKKLDTSELYFPELVPVVKAAQERAGLKPDGVIGPRTVKAIAGTSKADRLAKVRLALEELRWLPSDLGATRVFINQPAFTAAFVEDGVEKLNMRVVVGKPSNQTSFFYDEIEQVDYNPYWGVPQSILVNEMLPRLRRDPGYLDRAGYEVTDSHGRRIPSSAIAGAVRRQGAVQRAPGAERGQRPGRAEDPVPQQACHLHARHAAEGAVRARHAGLQPRLRPPQQPREMAAAVLGTSVDHIRDKLAQGHSSEKVTTRIPVYVAYFTAWPDAAGKVQFFDDVYGRDERLTEALTRTTAVRHPERLVDPVSVSDTGAAPPSGISDAELEAAVDAVN